MSVSRLDYNRSVGFGYDVSSSQKVRTPSDSSSVEGSRDGASVTLSGDAIHAYNSSEMGPPKWTEKISEKLHANPDKAEVMDYVKQSFSIPDHELITIGPDPENILKYAGTDIVVTPGSSEKFGIESQRVLKDRGDLLNNEIAKGTDPADIYDKMIGFMSSQPSDYLEKIGWYAKDGQR